MIRLSHLLIAACVFVVAVCQIGVAGAPHEDWLRAIEGTWTADDDDRGKVTVSFKSEAGGKCLVGTGTDKYGAFVTIIGWETWESTDGHTVKQLRWTSYHSNGSGGRTSFMTPLKTRMHGSRWSAGPGGESQLPSKVTVARERNTFTVSTTTVGFWPDIEYYARPTKIVYTKAMKK